MNKKEKRKIIIFAREGFRRFYSEYHLFLEDKDYKPGKKVYRNMTALNKMMECYLETSEDYIIKSIVKSARGWDGPSTYAQYERIITNFGLSDTSWKNSDRAVLLLSEKGKELRDKYRDYVDKHPHISLSELQYLPEFARRYLIKQLEETNSSNMTLWKNILLSAIYLYTVLGTIPRYSSNQSVSETERNAFINCCNYTKNGRLMDVSYFPQPAHMLRNLQILDDNYVMTEIGYKLLLNLRIFEEVSSSVKDYEETFENEVEAVEEILDSNTELLKVDAPERKLRKATVDHKKAGQGSHNRNFDELDKKNRVTGDLGERLVFDYEKTRLSNEGVTDIDNKLIWTSKDPRCTNTYPYDFKSIDPATNEDIYIEVKTTRYAADTPFYISEEERKFSEDNASQYRLYRVFDAIRTKEPKFFETFGYVGDNFTLTSDRYIATRDKEE